MSLLGILITETSSCRCTTQGLSPCFRSASVAASLRPSLPRLVQGAAVKWQESHTGQRRNFSESCLVWLSCHSGIGHRKSWQWTIIVREQQRITFCQKARALSLKVTMKLIKNIKKWLLFCYHDNSGFIYTETNMRVYTIHKQSFITIH